MNLKSTVGKTITDFCRFGFTGAEINHCAHFVSHVLNLRFGMTCSRLMGQGTDGASVRVHELFAACAQVGFLENLNTIPRPVLVFVTAKSNVNLNTKKMENVPKKHVGIYDGTHIYHYGNTRDKVVKQTVQEFKQSFQNSYGGTLGYYFGTIAQEAEVVLSASSVESGTGITYEIRNKEVFAQINQGTEFFVARRVSYGSRIGLAQTNRLTGPVFKPAQYEGQFGPWAYLVYAIGVSESKNYFNRINSYDRAAFTFGFFQFAAHTPKDNLIVFLRQATELEEFRRFFPDLQLQNGRLHSIQGNQVIDLEAETFDPRSEEMQLRNLMRYLNPDEHELDKTEIKNAAKLVALCEQSPAFCDLQVRTAIQITTHKFRDRYQHWYQINGAIDSLCVAIADIHHQGRGTKAQVRSALGHPNPLQELTKIGASKYPERCRSLRETITRLEHEGKLGKHKYEPAHGLFVPV